MISSINKKKNYLDQKIENGNRKKRRDNMEIADS